MKWLKSFLGIFFKKYRTTYSVSFNDNIKSEMIKQIVDEKPRFFKLASSKYKNPVIFELMEIFSRNNKFYFKIRNIETLSEITHCQDMFTQKFVEVAPPKNILAKVTDAIFGQKQH